MIVAVEHSGYCEDCDEYFVKKHLGDPCPHCGTPMFAGEDESEAATWGRLVLDREWYGLL